MGRKEGKNKMSSSVMIKSFQNGIAVILDDTIAFPVLLEEVGLKFKESASFFRNSKMAEIGRASCRERVCRLV